MMMSHHRRSSDSKTVSLDDGWAKVQPAPRGGAGAGGLAQGAYETAASVASGAASLASGAAQSAYQFVAGDEKSR